MPPSQTPKTQGLGEPETSPPEPKPSLGEPEVPPLGSTSSKTREQRQTDHGETIATSPTPTTTPREHQVSYEATESVSTNEATAINSAPEQVVLRGQIITEDTAAGPRVLADVEPIASSGDSVAFRGPLSLMVLNPLRKGRAANVARWDFSVDELKQATVQSNEGTVLEFPLQLPPGKAMGEPVELWVRLLRDDGRKLLAHATIDLGRDGEFCSAGRATLPTVARAVQIVDTGVPSMETRAGAVRKTDWQVARPDDPASSASTGSEPNGEWHTATQPIPMAPLAAKQIASPQPLVKHPAAEPVREIKPAEMTATRPAPTWSPERAEDPKPAVPEWAPTR